MYVIMITFLQDMIVLTLNNLSEKKKKFTLRDRGVNARLA